MQSKTIRRLRMFLLSLPVAVAVSSSPALAGDDAAVATPEFSRTRGFYHEPFELRLTAATAGAEIRYTTDGSEPDRTRGQLYRAPLTLSTTTVLRAVTLLGEERSGCVATATYLFVDDIRRQTEMDSAVVDDPEYRDEVENALTSIPTLSIALDPAAVAQEDAVLLTEDEYPASLEFIDSTGGGVQVDCGVERHSNADPKTSLRVSFKKEYGAGKLRHPLLASATHHAHSAVQTFDRLILRGGKNKSWPNGSFRRQVTYVEDQWVRDTQLAMSGVGARGTFTHLYVNGVYWGLYNPVERPDAWFTSAYFGGEAEDYLATNMNYRRGRHLSGDPTRFEELVEMAAAGLDTPEEYAAFGEYLDVERYIDYVILFWFTGMGDGVNNNWYGGMRNDPPGPFRFFAWDGEFIFLPPEPTPLGNEGAWVPPYFFDDSLERRLIVQLWQALLPNEEFQVLFSDRVYKHCFADGALSDDSGRRRLQELATFVDSAMVGEAARWGEGRTRNETWRTAVSTLDGKLDGNVKMFIDVLRDWSDDDWIGVRLYPELDPPTLEPPGGEVPSDGVIRLVRPDVDRGADGAFYYTLDGSDPRAAGGGVAPGAALYEEPFSLGSSETGKVVVKVRTRQGGSWSAVHTATFRTLASRVAAAVRISEIHYHPLDGGAEFLELHNRSNEPVDLSGASFTDGIDYTFEPGSVLAPGGYFVLAADAADFAARYPGAPLDAVYGKKLDNGGERITLTDAVGKPVLSVAYDDEFLWPHAPDGLGATLVAEQGSLDPDEPGSWRPSRSRGGSPGAPDVAGSQMPGDITQDGQVNISDGIGLLVRLFGEPGTTLPCAGEGLQAGGNLQLFDLDLSGGVGLTDAVRLLIYLFAGGAPHPLGTDCIRLEGCQSVCS